jgi:monovalent cation:H+ antiporter-2, CPA2 family
MIRDLESRDVPCLFGDASNPELLADLDLEQVQVVISNITHFVTNSLLLQQLEAAGSKALIIATCDDPQRSAELYSAGATYVIMPHYLGGTKLSSLIERYGLSRDVFEREQHKHRKYLSQVHGIV